MMDRCVRYAYQFPASSCLGNNRITSEEMTGSYIHFITVAWDDALIRFIVETGDNYIILEKK